jgi:PAS domain S-box-containing protein
MLTLADALRPLSDPIEIMHTASRLLGEHLAVNRAFYSTIVDEDTVVVHGEYRNGVSPLPGRFPLAAFGEQVIAAFKRGDDFIIDDVATDPRLTESQRAAWASLDTASAIGIGLLKGGRWVGGFGVNSATPRTWSSEDVALLRETAERTWEALERAKAEAARRDSEERYTALFEQSPLPTALGHFPDGIIVNVNPALCRLLEFERGEMIGKTADELGIMNPEDRAAVAGKVDATGAVHDFECVRITKSGKKRIVLLDVFPVTAAGERYILTKIRDITEQRRAEEGARLYEQSRDRLLDLDAMERLHRVSVLSFDEDRPQAVIDAILETAIAITESNFGTVQVLDPQSSDIQLVAARGFPRWWIQYWNRVPVGLGACGAALERRERVIVEDVTQSQIFKDSHVLEIQLRAGIRAIQSTPLLDRSGSPLGMISTHYTSPRRPSERALRRLDLLARQAADIFDRARRETELRRREAEQRMLADVGGALSTLDYDRALASVTRVAVESLADFAVMFVVEEGGSVQRVAASSRDTNHAWMPDLMLSEPSVPRPAHPVWEVIATRRPTITTVEPAQYEHIAESPEHLHALRAAAPTSTLLVPMLAGDACLGALGLASASRAFDQRDVRLAEEVGRRCALFVENARLHDLQRRAIRTRGEVVGIVAHDLRNPLHSIVLNSRILEHQGADPESVDAIRRSAMRMDRIIQDLLDVSRFEAGTFELEGTRLRAADLVKEAVKAHRNAVGARGLELRLDVIDELPTVWADKARVTQVFENLISNAMRFTMSGVITVGAKTSDANVTFWVADTGEGIDPENLPRLFDPFWQARQDRHEGAGLGLSIVRTIVEAHGGRVWATSQPSAGSTFFFTLPTATAPGGIPTPPEPDFVQVENRLALIADDDPDLRRALADVLRHHGFGAVAVANGRDALDYLRRGVTPAVMILDLAMPVLDGWGVLEERSASPALRAIPVIVLSGQLGVGESVAAMHATFLQKPVAPDHFIEVVESVVRSASAASSPLGAP